MRKSVLLFLCALIVLSFVFTEDQFAEHDRNKGKRKPSPTVTVNELMLNRSHFHHSFTNTPAAITSVMYATYATGRTIWWTGVSIPTNATITGLTMRAKMNFNATNDSEKLILYVYRINDYGSRILVTQVKSNYNAGNTNFRTKSRSLSLSVTDQGYEIWVSFPGTDTVAAGNYEVAWVKISYTTP